MSERLKLTFRGLRPNPKQKNRNNFQTTLDRAEITINQKYEIGFRLSEHVIGLYLRRNLAAKSKNFHFRFAKIAHITETVLDMAQVIINQNKSLARALKICRKII